MKKIIFFLSIFLIGCSATAEYDNFAQCLTDKGAVMYGTEWCSHCKNQKAEFGKSFQYVNFVDCDLDKIKCDSEGVTGYPTWVINGDKYPGAQPMYKLASATGCEI